MNNLLHTTEYLEIGAQVIIHDFGDSRIEAEVIEIIHRHHPDDRQTCVYGLGPMEVYK